MSGARMSNTKLLWVAFALAVFAMARLAPPLDGLTPLGQSVLGTVLAGSILWAWPFPTTRCCAVVRSWCGFW